MTHNYDTYCIPVQSIGIGIHQMMDERLRCSCRRLASCELRVTGLKYPTFPHILGKGGRFRTALGYHHPESHLFFTYFGERWEISHRPGVSSDRKSLIFYIFWGKVGDFAPPWGIITQKVCNRYPRTEELLSVEE